MTLTGRVTPEESLRVIAAIEVFFGAVLEDPVTVDGLALFVEREAGAPFCVQSYHPPGLPAGKKDRLNDRRNSSEECANCPC